MAREAVAQENLKAVAWPNPVVTATHTPKTQLWQVVKPLLHAGVSQEKVAEKLHTLGYRSPTGRKLIQATISEIARSNGHKTKRRGRYSLAVSISNTTTTAATVAARDASDKKARLLSAMREVTASRDLAITTKFEVINLIADVI